MCLHALFSAIATEGSQCQALQQFRRQYTCTADTQQAPEVMTRAQGGTYTRAQAQFSKH